MQGSLVVFEGPDGAGKSAVAEQYARYLEQRGTPIVSLSFPGRAAGTIGRLVYGIHHEPKKFDVDGMTPESLQALHIAAHLDAIDSVIRPHIERGAIVVLDRFWWSTWVYGIDAGANRETLEALIACEVKHWGSLVPTAFLLTRRDSLRAADGGPAWHRRVALYRELAKREAVRHPVHYVDNDGTLEETVQEVIHRADTVGWRHLF